MDGALQKEEWQKYSKKPKKPKKRGSMTDYYVRKTGSDSDNGLTPGAAKLTIDAAANLVTPGSTVYIGAGVYRELVTMDTTGSSGNQITFIGDVAGYYTGDAGLVVISAYPSETTQAARACCLDTDGRVFVTWRGVVFDGGTFGAVFSNNTSNDNYEGCTFEDCVMIGGHDVADFALDVDMNAATTPSGNGLTFDRCVFGGRSRLRFDGNASADQNLKIQFNSPMFAGKSTLNTADGFLWDIVTANTFGSGGVTINNALFYCAYGLSVDDGAATTYPVAAYNSIFYRCYNAVNKTTDNDGALIENYNRFYSCGTERTNVTAGAQSLTDANVGPPLMGGIADILLYRYWGWSPYRPFEPIRFNDDSYVPELIGAGSSAYAPAFDLYNEARPGGIGEAQYYWFNASDAAAVDNEAVWANDANAFDGLITSASAQTSTAGSNSTNELFGEGTNAPSSGPTIVAVRMRVFGYISLVGGSPVGHAEAFTDGRGESLGEVTWNNTDTTGGKSDWTTLSTPSGGWDYTKLQALEVAFWRTADSGVNTVNVRVCELEVQTAPADDIGAVEARARPEKETSTVRTGLNSARFEGAGFHDMPIPVGTGSSTVSVYGRYDANYTGTLPQLKVMNIPGVADQTDVMVGAAGNWEQLSVNFTPTSVGVARIRLVSNDTSRAGNCYFDDLEVT